MLAAASKRSAVELPPPTSTASSRLRLALCSCKEGLLSMITDLFSLLTGILLVISYSGAVCGMQLRPQFLYLLGC